MHQLLLKMGKQSNGILNRDRWRDPQIDTKEGMAEAGDIFNIRHQ
jgi:hypothetical protein